MNGLLTLCLAMLLNYWPDCDNCCDLCYECDRCSRLCGQCDPCEPCEACNSCCEPCDPCPEMGLWQPGCSDCYPSQGGDYVILCQIQDRFRQAPSEARGLTLEFHRAVSNVVIGVGGADPYIHYWLDGDRSHIGDDEYAQVKEPTTQESTQPWVCSLAQTPPVAAVRVPGTADGNALMWVEDVVYAE